uniref:Uncharacterized protein n=1 Tax=Arion vulgaris TaxID=1028688 RepID=A0A0B7BGK2_9EUPU
MAKWLMFALHSDGCGFESGPSHTCNFFQISMIVDGAISCFVQHSQQVACHFCLEERSHMGKPDAMKSIFHLRTH